MWKSCKVLSYIGKRRRKWTKDKEIGGIYEKYAMGSIGMTKFLLELLQAALEHHKISTLVEGKGSLVLREFQGCIYKGISN